MALSDAIIVGENWISEHYLGTDGKQSFNAKVLERRKAWDETAKADEETTRSRFGTIRGDLLSQYANLGSSKDFDREDLKNAYQELLSALGYDRASLHSVTKGPATFIKAAGLEGAAPLAVIEAKPVKRVEELLVKKVEGKSGKTKEKHNLLEPYDVDDDGKEVIYSVASLLSHLFVGEDAPQFALVLAGPIALIAEKERWPEGRYLAIDLQVVAERNDAKKGGEVDTALTCLDAASLAPDADGNQWWAATLEDSIKHTVGVSKDLREGVRLSIEIISNEVVKRREAKRLPPLPDDEAQPLAKQALRYLYRILFLLYAEASPELGVLPSGDPTYEHGYSLDRLRELTLVPIESPKSQQGTHLYESLARLFDLVDRGHDGAGTDVVETVETTAPDGQLELSARNEIEGLTFRALKADLFLPKATSMIDEVQLGNEALQKVLQHLLLSKEASGKDRGFISYAELGINQLGAVYEGLMSYTGFFAKDDLYEVAKDGDSEKGSWIVPVDRSESIAAKDFVKTIDPVTGESKPVLHERGTFVYRLAGRERQQSASYYTPEVLTRFTVGQALEELLDQEVDGEKNRTSAREILDLTVCEPALGSGAFAIEAVRQLAEQYLRRIQEETGEKIDPDQYPAELQKVKSYLALHNVYGVDLNATAVELAEISLWLDTMGKGLQAPWFGLHLRRGNSLIGARRALFRTDQVTGKQYLGKTAAIPKDLPLSEEYQTGIHHFLVPADGWGAAVDAKEAKTIAPDAQKALRDWQKQVRVKLSKKQVDELSNLARRVETLWSFATERLRIAESEIRRSIDIWGADDLPVGGAVTREQIEESLHDARGAYQRLRRVMDAWCAMWFWPLTDELTTATSPDGTAAVIAPPTIDEWIAGLKAVLGTHVEVGKTGKGRKLGADQTLASTATWEELGEAEALDLGFAGAEPPKQFLREFPWLVVAERIAKQQGFFHWDLDFAQVFADRGGFDLQVGNPPWVRPRSDVEALLAEGDPWWQLKAKSTAAEDKRHREFALTQAGVEDLVLDGTADIASIAAFVGSAAQYPHLAGLQPDFYRCFMEQTWRHAAPARRPSSVNPSKTSDGGVVALIHLESHFTDEKAGLLRTATYRRLRRHWQFINELLLFSDIEDHKRYGVNVYGSPREPRFFQAASLYHPDTVLRSLVHDGSGPQPAIKDDEGKWDVRPHQSRITTVEEATLKTWHEVLEDENVPIHQTRMVYAVNKATADVLNKLAAAPRIGDLDLRFSSGWHEKNDRTKGYFDSEWGAPESWDDVILQGPNLHIGLPFFKYPNPTMLHNQDWTPVDLEALPPDAIPVTSYKPAYLLPDGKTTKAEYDAAYSDWSVGVSAVPARGFYRIAWRRQAAPTGERTIMPAIIPPGASHVDGIFSAGTESSDKRRMVIAAAFASSLLGDFSFRSTLKGDIRRPQFERLPANIDDTAAPIIERYLRLTCVTDAYAHLWEYCVGSKWTPEVPLRNDFERRQAMIEIDALVALALGISADELTTIYRTQFPVLRGYDIGTSRSGDYLYDANGRLLPTKVRQVWAKRRDAISVDERTEVHPGSRIAYTYDLPFARMDREADLRAAYSRFESEMQNPPSAAEETSCCAL